MSARMRRPFGLLVVGAALAAPAAAADEPRSTPPDWLRRPSPDDLYAVFPREAWSRGRSGKAVVACKVSPQGALLDCKAESESPEGMGFGAAAIALTPQFLMKPATVDGQPVVSSVRIPINFTVPKGPNTMVGARPVLDAASAWREAPSYDDVVAAYPDKARKERVGGRATLKCNLTEAGRLSGCSVIAEAPRNYGFGTAAKQLAAKFHSPIPPDRAKALRRAQVQVPVTFAPEMLDPGGRLVGKPRWAVLPSQAALGEIIRTLPADASVRVVLNCAVRDAGFVTDCAVAEEAPGDYQLSPRVLALTDQFKLTTWTAEGLPTIGGRVNIPLRFQTKTEEEAEPSSAP